MTDAAVWTVDEPWLHVLPATADIPVRQAFPAAGTSAVVVLDANRMANTELLFEQFDRGLRFPEYFGWNWDALLDCLRDLSWFPADGYLIVITNADRLLADEPAEREVLFRVLRHAARNWARPVGSAGVPFNVLLTGRTELIELGADRATCDDSRHEPGQP
ncbi:barstar family protein [Kutzneria buriramensis]|uniref:Barstar (Barnase inhibitor) n=1 Tax=Kutzneria buriramensis TaxID=1045776 RepID=A0A3E0I923_9PSEU|nr:barstar family protein [Kutzneria buriramensis]REH55111.1 barstar (barnase inhibitor) [Kutzneria buriramensis]